MTLAQFDTIDGDPTKAALHRCRARLSEIKDGLARIEAFERQQTEECLRRCEILELKSEIERLRWDLREAQCSRR